MDKKTLTVKENNKHNYEIIKCYDDVFKYSESSLYEKEYITTPYSTLDTCSNFFGATVAEKIIITKADNVSLIFIDEDQNQTTLPYLPQDITDAYVYEAEFYGLLCLFGLSTQNMSTQSLTIDQLMIYCGTDYSYNTCTTRYFRTADYDFTSQEIKTAEFNSSDVIKDMMK